MGQQRRGSVSCISLLQMILALCGGVDGPEMYELLSGPQVCVWVVL